VRSCWVLAADGATSLEFREVPEPRAAPGEIVLRVRAAGLNRGELIAGSVMHGGPAKHGGTEAAGEVEAVGEGVSGIRPGDRIMGRVLSRTRGGSFARYAAMDAAEAMPVPARLTWEQAAAIPVSFLVTYDALVAYGRLQRDEWVLVTGVSSATGVACLQTAKCLGARVAGTSGSAAKLERLKAIGLDTGIVGRGAPFAAEVLAATGGTGADLAVNCVGGSVFAECVRSLAFGGRLATVGYVDGVFDATIDLRTLHANRLVVYGVSNSRLSLEGRAASVRGFTRDVLPAVAEGRLTPLIDRAYDFEELPAAKRYMESGAQVGKIVINGM